MAQPVAAVLTVLCALAIADPSRAEDRTLSFHYTHTRENLTVTYKRNGHFDPQALSQLNKFLRDWRRDEVARMDPKLFDILWEVHRASGSRQPIHIISAYRSPQTNEKLRARSRGVAKNSQHTQGKAMDFFLPDVPIEKVREIGLKLQAGGVGFYPSPGFVHLDTGRVRHWPRMTRQQLVRLFPNGETLHLPADGRPLDGYQRAAQSNARLAAQSGPVAASASPTGQESPTHNRRQRSLLARVFGVEADEESDMDDAGRTTRPIAASTGMTSPRAQRSADSAPVSATFSSAAMAPVPVPAPREARVAPPTTPFQVGASEAVISGGGPLSGASTDQIRRTLHAGPVQEGRGQGPRPSIAAIWRGAPTPEPRADLLAALIERESRALPVPSTALAVAKPRDSITAAIPAVLTDIDSRLPIPSAPSPGQTPVILFGTPQRSAGADGPPPVVDAQPVTSIRSTVRGVTDHLPALVHPSDRDFAALSAPSDSVVAIRFSRLGNAGLQTDSFYGPAITRTPVMRFLRLH